MDLSGAEPCTWEVDSIPLERPIKQLSDLHYLAAFGGDDLEPGGDFLFWYWFTQALKQRLLRDQYLPALRYRQPPKPKGKRKLPAPEFYGAWQWAVGDDDPLIAEAVERMPAACAAGLGAARNRCEAPARTPTRNARSSPRACCGTAPRCCSTSWIRQTKWPATFQKRVDNTLLAPCLAPTPAAARWTPSAHEPAAGLELQRQWQAWRERIVGSEQNAAFRLGFRLAEPPDDGADDQAAIADDGHRGQLGACTSSPSPRTIPRTICRWRTTGPQPNRNAPSIAPASAPTSSNTCC